MIKKLLAAIAITALVGTMAFAQNSGSSGSSSGGSSSGNSGASSTRAAQPAAILADHSSPGLLGLPAKRRAGTPEVHSSPRRRPHRAPIAQRAAELRTAEAPPA